MNKRDRTGTSLVLVAVLSVLTGLSTSSSLHAQDVVCCGTKKVELDVIEKIFTQTTLIGQTTTDIQTTTSFPAERTETCVIQAVVGNPPPPWEAALMAKLNVVAPNAPLIHDTDTTPDGDHRVMEILADQHPSELGAVVANVIKGMPECH